MDLTSINSFDLYNSPLSEYVFAIIDYRKISDYEISHIPTSFCARKYSSFELLSEEIDDLGCENSTSVVVYADESLESQEYKRNLFEYFNSRHITPIELEGGFAAFQSIFPGIVAPDFPISTYALPSYISAVNIYLGSKMSADSEQLKKLNVKTIVNAGASEAIEVSLTENFAYLYLPLVDAPSQLLEPILSDAITFIEQHSQDGGPVFVHCSQGVSRSVSIVIAYLIRKFDFTYDSAFDYVQSCRKIARPNLGFVMQLKALTINNSK